VLEKNERYILSRTVFSSDTSSSRKSKKIPCEKLLDKTILVDGYNVLITLESLLQGERTWIADDSFLRDIQGVFMNHTNDKFTTEAVEKMLSFLSAAKVERVEILLDTQMKNSGDLAAFIRKRMKELLIKGDARTSKHVDHDLKNCPSDYVVATADGVIIDAVKNVVDIPGYIAANTEKLTSNSSNSP
jgi:hypothetical protein